MTPVQPRHFVLIRNPVAGRRNPSLLRRTLAALREAGHQVDVHDTAGRGDAERLAREIAGGPELRIVAAGGDGTINEVVNGLMLRNDDISPPLGILPLGTANVLAGEVGLHLRPAAIVRALTSVAPSPVHVGRLCTESGAVRHFSLMAGAGFDAKVVAGVDSALKRRLGKGAYVWRSAVEMTRPVDALYAVDIDGVRHEAASVIVTRARRYGGPYPIAPDADLRMPGLSTCLFERGGRYNVLRYGAALVRGRLPRTPGYRVLPATSVRIVTLVNGHGHREPVQLDGDDAADLPVTVDVAPRQLRLLMPG
ncbi:MAG: diacylglycerol kinase family lipid kinase [Alphaproteobacteria bacterium]|nr:diacylglycerol kinase family lipid kinase [Alphaproteobacteria bacterium]MCW5742101.1 diacylglycerol kinase family lipid kinase [Alphaproteobacteria bacterium]